VLDLDSGQATKRANIGSQIHGEAVSAVPHPVDNFLGTVGIAQR